MSVSSTTNRVTVSGNGTTTAFAFPYYFMAQSDLVVETTDVSGTVSLKVLGTDYTISGTTDSNGLYSSGGTVNFVAAPATGLTVTIYRDPPATQASVWSDTDFAKSIGFDKLTLLIQRMKDLASRAPTLSDGFVGSFTSTLPTVMTPNAFLAVNAGGNGWTLVGTGVAQGTVTSIGLSVPAEFSAGAAVTTAGTISITKNSQAQNLVWASPNGSSGVPVFRSLVATDIPIASLSLSSMSSGAAGNGQVPVANGSGGITWQTILGTGTVTSVGVAVPAEFSATAAVTTAGTITISKAAQTKNTVWAGPSSGVNASPSFRQLAPADLPAMAGATSLAAGTAGMVPQPNAGDQVHFLRGDGAWVAVPQGTVTSVDLAVPGEFSVSGDPITGSGTITLSKTTQAKNTVWAGPTGGVNAIPTFRAIVSADLPVFVGATGLAAGVAGSVPTPSAGQNNLFLRGDATWSTPTTTAVAQGPQQFTSNVNATLSSVPQSMEASGTITLTLPSAASLIQSSGGNFYASQIIITNTGTGTITIAGHLAETIQGASTATLQFQWSSITLYPNAAGNGWLIT